MSGVRLLPRQVRFRALGTAVSVLFVGELPRGSAGAIRALFAEWEATLSRFAPHSELSLINRSAGRPAPAGPLLRSVLRAAVSAARSSDGLFDPTLGRQMAAIGYDRSFEGPVRLAGGTFVRDLPSGGWRTIQIDDAAGLVTIPAGTALDLGGIAKGMAVDAAVALLLGTGATGALVNAGGDMRVVCDGAADWHVGFDEADSHTVTLTGGAIATSGITTRRWTQGGIKQHHLIDPRTASPARSDLRTVSVAAPTCAQAEVAAKVALLLGSLDGARFLAQRDLPGVMTLLDGSAQPTPSWPDRAAA